MKMSRTKRLVIACNVLLLALLGCLSTAANADLAEADVAALRPLLCGSCLHPSDLKLYEMQPGFNAAGPGYFNKQFLKDPAGRAANVLDVRNESLQGQLALATLDPNKRAFTKHVCVGVRVPMAVGTIGVDAPSPNLAFVKVAAHPDAVDGVCDGELRSLETFFKAVVASTFAEQLALAEKRTAPEAISEALRANLADVLSQHKADMMKQIKQEIVADLRKDSGADPNSPVTPNPGELPKAESCTTGIFSCKGGKKLTECCMCAGSASAPKSRRGTCDAQGNLGSWRPAADDSK